MNCERNVQPGGRVVTVSGTRLSVVCGLGSTNVTRDTYWISLFSVAEPIGSIKINRSSNRQTTLEL